MSYRISRALLQRFIGSLGSDNAVQHFINWELVPLLRELLHALTIAPQPFAWSAGVASINASQSTDWAASVTMTTDCGLLINGGYEGAQGVVLVQQDAVGGRLLNVLATGYTVLREDPAVASDPNPAANSITRYRYTFVTVVGVPYVLFERLYLL